MEVVLRLGTWAEDIPGTAEAVVRACLLVEASGVATVPVGPSDYHKVGSAGERSYVTYYRDIHVKRRSDMPGRSTKQDELNNTFSEPLTLAVVAGFRRAVVAEVDRIGYTQQALLKQQLEAYLDIGTDLGTAHGEEGV